MNNNVGTSALSELPVKLVCCIAFGSASSFCYFLISIVINLEYFLI